MTTFDVVSMDSTPDLQPLLQSERVTVNGLFCITVSQSEITECYEE